MAKAPNNSYQSTTRSRVRSINVPIPNMPYPMKIAAHHLDVTRLRMASTRQHTDPTMKLHAAMPNQCRANKNIGSTAHHASSMFSAAPLIRSDSRFTAHPRQFDGRGGALPARPNSPAAAGMGQGGE